MAAPEVEAAFRTLVDAIGGAEPLPAGGAAGVAAIAMGVGHVKASVAGDLSAAIELVCAERRIAVSNARENALRLPPEEAERLLASLDRRGE